jgi:hypothetical protein
MAVLDDNEAEELEFLRGEVRRLRSQLDRLTPSLSLMLKRRGFTVFKKEPSADLLVPAPQFLDSFYSKLHKYSFRLLLRDIIKRQDRFTLESLTRYSTVRVVRSYLNYLQEIKMIREGAAGYTLMRGPVASFGPTLEWYVAELLRRELGAEVLWDVKFRRRSVGGDYDVLAKLGGSLLYAEVKSSPPKQVTDSEIAAFLDRVEDLAPELSLFLMDTELRMKDKVVPMFEAAFSARRSGLQVSRVERELFTIGDRIYIANAKESIGRNIEKVVARFMGRAVSNPSGAPG